MPLNASIVGCNSSNDNSDDGNGKLSCPSALLVPYHKVNILTDELVPEKIAIFLEGEEKYNECLDQTVIPPPPIVTGQRNKDGLSVTVQHFGAYNELPETVSFEVYNVGDCSGGTKFYEAVALPLEFQKVHPHGPECGSNTTAEISVSK